MKKHLFVALICAATSMGCANPGLAGNLSDAELIKLQVTMQGHIDASLVDGALLTVDAETGNTLRYYPSKAHPKVMTMGDGFIMCAEVSDANGKASMANFYVAKDKDRFVVYHTTIGADPALEKLMRDGRVAMAN